MLTDMLLKKKTLCFKQQQGAATLVVAVVLLVIVLGISFFTAEVVISEKKVTANVYRAKQAFHAAQAGIDYGIAYSREGFDQDGDSVLDLTIASGAERTASVGSATYTVSFLDVSSDADMALVEVSSVGFSDDEQIQRTISILIGEVPLVPNPPDLPIVARGYVNATGNLNVYNVFSNLNIWSGTTVSSWGSADTYIRDPDWDNSGDWDGSTDLSAYLDSKGLDQSDVDTIQSTTKNTRGPDVIDGDANLDTATEDEFTENFFGRTLAELVSLANLSMTASELSAADSDDIKGKLIYLSDAKINGGTIGTPTDPVILVADSPLSISGGPQIYGVIIANSVDKVVGTADIFGGIVSENALDMGSGTANVYYDENVVNNLDKINTKEVVRGSWRDW
ncbi:hypothetical protein KDX31_19800 (plasmid) [Amphritea atlantica]|uniref:Type 4 fimbrial biogenesis protein PilX N-terminal domain-containing protein n=1 Tax=Amphritea atlantica TaxID=355243 RepID=A0ABY5H037_9GAMM|nr:hypothetical protein KDX31_19800 [Amphritea atlantica]